MICPACKHNGRRKKNKCAKCGVGLEASGRLTEDKLFCDKVILKLEQHIKNRDGIKPFILRNKRERKFVYNLLDRAKTFLEGQSIDIGLTPTEFLELVLEKEVYENKFYNPNIDSHLMLQNAISQMAWTTYRKLKNQHYQKQQQQASLKISKGSSHIGNTATAL